MRLWSEVIEREETRIEAADAALELGEWPSNRRTAIDDVIIHELVPFDPMRVDVFIRYHANLR